MKHNETNGPRPGPAAHAADTLRRAQELVNCRSGDRYEEDWVHEANHVGDLSVLAITLRS
jgi:hypothetical protein